MGNHSKKKPKRPTVNQIYTPHPTHPIDPVDPHINRQTGPTPQNSTGHDPSRTLFQDVSKPDLVHVILVAVLNARRHAMSIKRLESSHLRAPESHHGT